FDLVYIDQYGQRKRPVMIHRVILGAIERFVAILIEHYGGAFPLWLAPVQVAVLTVADRHIPYAEEVIKLLSEKGFRVQPDFRNEKLGAKIREGEIQKIPYLLVIGDKEVEGRSVTPRQKGKATLPTIKLEEFVMNIEKESQQKGVGYR
ncbi:MAG: His/Gly/Thr/Pro-type tRNA ligase C-terminal domain-containing protein, partial [Desulfatiglandales bacterium]